MKKTQKKVRKKAKKTPRKKTQKKVKKKTQKKAVKKIQKKSPGKTQKKTRKKVQKKPVKTPPKEKEIGIITHYFNNISVGIIKLKAELNTGDKIHVKGAHDDFTQVITSMQVNHKDIARAKKGAEVGIKVPKRVHENDKVYIAAGE